MVINDPRLAKVIAALTPKKRAQLQAEADARGESLVDVVNPYDGPYDGTHQPNFFPCRLKVWCRYRPLRNGLPQVLQTMRRARDVQAQLVQDHGRVRRGVRG